MPPKKEEARPTSGGAPSFSVSELIEIFKDPTVADAIANALGPFIARAIDSALEKKIGELNATVDALTIETDKLKAKVEDQGRRLKDMEIYSRAHDLIIRGLPEGSYAEKATACSTDSNALMLESHASVECSILSLCIDKLGVAVSQSDISVAHRLKAGKSDKHRPIIVRFNSRRIRDEVLRAKKKLMTTPADRSNTDNARDKVFISEHLTRAVSNLFFEARKLVREKRIASSWTHKGLVNIKRTTNPNEKPTIIRSLTELSQLH